MNEIYQKDIKSDKVKEVVRIAKKAGIHPAGFFMLGAPTETEEEIGKTISLAVSSGLTEASFSITTALPGTRLFEMIKNDGRLTISQDYLDFDYYRKLSYSGGNLSGKRLKYFQKKALLLFYLHPSRWMYIFKHFLSIEGILKLYYKVRRFF